MRGEVRLVPGLACRSDIPCEIRQECDSRARRQRLCTCFDPLYCALSNALYQSKPMPLI